MLGQTTKAVLLILFFIGVKGDLLNHNSLKKQNKAKMHHEHMDKVFLFLISSNL